MFFVISAVTVFSHNTSLLLNRWLGILKIMILLALVTAGIFMGAAHPTTTPVPNTDIISTSNRLSSLLAAFAHVLFSFQGWETASYVSLLSCC
jgi:amino acid transporter